MLTTLFLIVAFLFRRSGIDIAAVYRFLPHLGRLVTALYRDPRVPGQARLLLAALLAYLAAPVDIIPSFIPLFGYVDDVVVGTIALDGVFSQIDPALVREHWGGDEKTLIVVRRSTARLSPLMPKAWKRKLFSR